MTTMLSAGIPITKAISITAKVLDNYYISNEVGKLAAKLEEGYALGASMRESGCMPDILTDMVAVGEETGEMEETLRTIAAYYDQELQMATDAALKSWSRPCSSGSPASRASSSSRSIWRCSPCTAPSDLN